MTISKAQKNAMLALRESQCAQTVALHFMEMEMSGRVEKRDAVKSTHTLLMSDLYKMYNLEYPGLMSKTEYFAGMRKIERLTFAGAKVLGYVNPETVPQEKDKAPSSVKSQSEGKCVDCGMEILTPAGGASHAKKTGHTVKVQTVLNTTFNPKA